MGTRRLITAIIHGARGRIALIFFDDPKLLRQGLTQYWPGHDNHLHVRFCLPHERDPLYRC